MQLIIGLWITEQGFLIPLSLPLSSFNFQDCQIIEKGGLENYIRDVIMRPGYDPHFPAFRRNTVDGANLTANKAGESHHLIGPGEK